MTDGFAPPLRAAIAPPDAPNTFGYTTEHEAGWAPESVRKFTRRNPLPPPGTNTQLLGRPGSS